MCNACVMESVKQKMLKCGPGPAPVIAAPLAAPLAAAVVTDLTHTLHPEFPAYDPGPQFFLDKRCDVAVEGYNLHMLRMSEHVGTHIDAPLHFTADGLSVAELPLNRLIAPLAVVDIREKAADDDDAQLTPDDLRAWIAQNGDLPVGGCVAMLSGWEGHLGTPRFRNADAAGRLHFPGFHVEAVQMLLEESETVGIATDTLSLDPGASADFAAHHAWLPRGRWGLECVANLAALPAAGATLIVGAPKFQGGTGGPSRVFALH